MVGVRQYDIIVVVGRGKNDIVDLFHYYYSFPKENTHGGALCLK